MKTWDIMDRLPEMQLPTLLGGGHDMHHRIAGSRLEIIEDASHLCFAGQPAVFNQLLNIFLAERPDPS